MQTTRREFVAGTAGAFAAAVQLCAQTGPLTAQQAIDKIRAALGPPKPGNTVDGFKAGDPNTVVTGIATMVNPTVPQLIRAASQRANLLITMEPLFYTANDDPGPRATDPTYLAKKKHLDGEKLVVYRLQDQWTVKDPDMFAKAIGAILGGRPVAGAPNVYEISERPLSALQFDRKQTGVRIVGDPAMRVRRVLISPGTTTLAAVMAGLGHADAVIAGEPREWEAVPYVLDSNTAGRPKGMMVLGRVMSLDPGLSEGAKWIQMQLPGIKTGHISSLDYYWKPGAPNAGGRP